MTRSAGPIRPLGGGRTECVTTPQNLASPRAYSDPRMRPMPHVKLPALRIAVIKECVQKVADKLHHTPEVCKKNYLFPELIEFYLKDKNKFMKFFKTNIDKQFTLFLMKN